MVLLAYLITWWCVVRVELVFGSSFGDVVVRDELRGWVMVLLVGVVTVVWLGLLSLPLPAR